MKRILYIVYAGIFYIYRLLPLNNNKTTFIMTHDKSINGNIMCMARKIKEEQPDHICKFITKLQLKHKNILKKIFEILKFLILTPYYLATSKTIFLDNIFLPMSYMKFNSSVKVIQLWHGCNTLKKFGQLSNTGVLKKIEKKANSQYTHVIVSSKKMIKLHKEAFGVNENVIYPLGLPRMDILFNKKKIEQEKNKFYKEYENLKNKKIILYAPTFRDNNISEFDSNMDLRDIVERLPSEYIIVNKFHPFVAQKYGKIDSERVIDMSNYEDLTRLLLVADILISDYSSIIFDYSILNKPIIYYAYDKEKYKENIRGFYYEYEKYVESEIVIFKYDLIKSIINVNYIDTSKSKFINKYVDYKDENSSYRIYYKIYKE